MFRATTKQVTDRNFRPGHRALLLLGLVVFVACMQWCYINWLSLKFDFYGFEYTPPGVAYLILAWVLSLVPGLWMPLSLSRPSQLVYWMLYLTVFIPSMFIPLFVRLNEPPKISGLMLTLFVGFAICGTSYLFPLRTFRTPNLKKAKFWGLLGFLTVTFSLVVISAYHSTMRLVSFEDIYELRNESIDKGALVNYSTMWLYGAFYPLLVGWGLYYKRIWLFLAGTAGQVLIYASFGTKASLLSVVFAVMFYFLFRFGSFPFGSKLTWGVAVLFLIVCLSVAFVDEIYPLQFVTASLVSMRTFGLPGLLTAQYYYFIQANPFTYYGHVKGLSLLIHNPYQDLLGTVVGYYFYFPLIDATAHLWATDGLAALGLPGVLLISGVCAFVFWLLDSATQKHDPRLVALVITYGAMNICSIGFFTTLLSGGLALLILLLYLTPPEEGPQFDVPGFRRPSASSVQHPA